MIRRVSAICFCAALCAAIPARANIIGVGSPNVSPDVFTAAGLGNPAEIYDSGPLPFSFDGNTGTYEEVVAPIPDNPFCSGCLGFGLLVELDSTSAYDLSTIRFGTWNSQTDVGYCSDCNSGGTSIPSTVFRGTGNNVGFNFSGSTFAPGDQSYLLVVLTNATSFWVNGGIFFNDTNGDATSSIFGGLAVPAPEPGTFAILGVAMLGLGGFRRWRTR